MKSHYYYPLIIPAVLILLLISGNYHMGGTLKNNSVEMITQLEQMEACVYNKNWDEAKNLSESLSNTWQRCKPSWAAMINHNEMDLIDQSLSKVKVFIADSNYTFSLSEMAVLKKLYDHIPESEELNITNIL